MKKNSFVKCVNWHSIWCQCPFRQCFDTKEKDRDREKGREKERESVKEKNTTSTSTKTVQPAETHLQPTRRKCRQPEKKNTPTILAKSSACQSGRHQGRQHVNSGISKQTEHPHDLNEHCKFCVKIHMQLAVSTRPHNTHQFGIGSSMERKRKGEREGVRNTDTSKACARDVKIRTVICCSKRKQIILQTKIQCL